MANCKRCDRCGSVYDRSESFMKDIPKITKQKVKGFSNSLLYSLAGNKLDFGAIKIGSPHEWLDAIDLCPNCGETLYNWLINGEEVLYGEQGTKTTKKET